MSVNVFLDIFWSALWCSKMSQSVMQKEKSFLPSRSRSQLGFMWLNSDSFCYVFWTADPFATILGLIVHYYKPECHTEKLDFCDQGLNHSKISKCQWMFVQITSEILNFFPTHRTLLDDRKFFPSCHVSHWWTKSTASFVDVSHTGVRH